MGKYLSLLSILVLSLIALTISVDATAAISENNLLDGVVGNFRTEAPKWEAMITNYASRLFWILAVIELTWVGITLGLGKEDLGNALGTIVRTFLVIGFFWGLVVNGFSWVTAIVGSMRQIGTDAAVVSGVMQNLLPSDIIELALIVGDRLMSGTGATPSSWSMIFPAVIIMVAFAVIAAEMVLILAESYLVLTGGIILLGFGASRFTNNFAVDYFKYGLSVGVKLMIMQFLIAVAWGILFQWGADYEANNMQTLTMLIASVVIAILVSRLPSIGAALINGSSFGSGLTPGGAASAFLGAAGGVGGVGGVGVGGVGGVGVGGTAAGAQATAGAGMAVNEASKLVPAQGATSTQMVTQTVSNLVSSSASDLGGKLTGNLQYQHGLDSARTEDFMESDFFSIVDDDVSSDTSGDDSVSSEEDSEYISPLNDDED